MRNLHELDPYRRTDASIIRHYGNAGDETCGAFELPSPIDHRAMLFCVASSGGFWEHISVSVTVGDKQRIPLWLEMEHVKRMFFLAEETVMQLHVPRADHINCCKYALHLWRPTDREIPRPPGWMVG